VRTSRSYRAGVLAYVSWPVVTEVHVGPLMLRPHGVLIAVGFLAGAVVMRRSTRRAGIADDRLWSVLEWGLLGGLIGMRVGWDLGHFDQMRSVVDLVAVWNGGMSLLGGLIGAVILGGVACRRARLPIVPMLDMAAPGLALGIAIGRFSDLIIGDHLGKPTSLPWGFRYEGGMHPLAGVPAVGTVVHPVALYDLLLTSALLLTLLSFARRPRASGSSIALFTLWYGTSRLFTDLLRTDPRRLVGLTGSQLTAGVAIVVVLAALFARARRSRSAPPVVLRGEPTDRTVLAQRVNEEVPT
jgi:phosphatidylglycerol:prolipoprotein diacylglycerol transferase